MWTSTTKLTLLSLAASAFSLNHDSVLKNKRHSKLSRTNEARTATGVAYYGYQNNQTNACGTLSLDSDFIAGLSSNFITGDNTANCFKHLTVTLADGSKSIDVVAMDNCGNCGPPSLYLSPAAFEALNGGSLDVGILNITWAFTSSSSNSPSSATQVINDAVTSSAATVVTTDASTTTTDASTTTDAATSTTKATSTDKATTTKTSKTSTAAQSTGTSSDGWVIDKSLTGQSLIDYFDSETGTNDNGGVADYVSLSSDLVSVNGDNHVILAVDSTANANPRKSVRMISSETYNSNSLLIFDITHMPAVCGAWPALWFVGSGTWPDTGEIDVIEGVNLYNQDLTSIHTKEGCSLEQWNVDQVTAATINIPDDLDCNAYDNSDQNCAFTQKSTSSFGPGFNSAGGGTYAMMMISSGIYVYRWAASDVPSDVTSGSPNPSTWTPTVFFSSSSCEISSFFKDMQLIINTNLGGTFPEGVWDTADAGGQSTTCKSSTGYDTAASYIENEGSAFTEAYWEINSIKIYKQ